MRSLTQLQIYLLSSALLASIMAFLLYPGWLYYDSTHQWIWAEKIVDTGWPDKLTDLKISTHWPIFNTVLRVPFYAISHGAGLYIWCQAFLVFFSIYLMASCFFPEGGRRLAILYATICLLPNVLNISVLHASDVMLAVFYLYLIALYWQYSSGQKTAHSYKPLIGACCAMILIQLLRNNAALSLFLTAPLFIWPLLPKPYFRKTITAVITAVVMITPAAINHHLNKTAFFSTSSNQGVALRLWIQNHSYHSESVQSILSKISKPQTEQLDPECYLRGIWCHQYYSSANGAAITLSVEMQSEIRNTYLMSFIESPVEWFHSNLPIMGAFSGVTAPLVDECIGRYDSRKNFKKDIGITMERNAIRNFFQAANKEFEWIGFSRPVYLLLVNLLLAIWLAMKSPAFAARQPQILALLYITLLYMAPIIMGAPDRQQRYFYPFVFPNLVLCIAMLIQLPGSFKKQRN
jgi:hypothetical protein